MPLFTAGDLDRRIRFERRVAAGFMGAGQATFEAVATVWAQVRDVLPSKGESQEAGITIGRRPCRIRLRYRSDLDGSMRIAIGALSDPDEPMPAGRRYLEIIGGPVELGRREGLEIMAQETSTDGGRT